MKCFSRIMRRLFPAAAVAALAAAIIVAFLFRSGYFPSLPMTVEYLKRGFNLSQYSVLLAECQLSQNEIAVVYTTPEHDKFSVLSVKKKGLFYHSEGSVEGNSKSRIGANTVTLLSMDSGCDYSVFVVNGLPENYDWSKYAPEKVLYKQGCFILIWSGKTPSDFIEDYLIRLPQ